MDPLRKSFTGNSAGVVSRVPAQVLQPVTVVVDPGNLYRKDAAAGSPVYYSGNQLSESSRIKSNSLIGKGVSFLSCDEKDVFINPFTLSNDLSRIDTPALNAMAPITVNYAADGFPRIEGKPWNGGRPSTGSEMAPNYDPGNPSSLISYGLVVDKETGSLPFAVLGFRIQCRIFDTELGASTVGIRVFAKDYDHEVINALLSVDSNEAEVIVPFFTENVVRSTAGAGDWQKTANQTLRFFASAGTRDGSYNLVFAAPHSGASTIADLPSFFTVTGQNVYTYVSPIMGTDKSVSSLVETLARNPRNYLYALQNLVK